MEFILQNNQALIAGSILGGLFILGSSLCCCCCKPAVVETDNSEEYDVVDVDDRNSKLAFMLMMLLLEDKGSNRKYIKMAESIGYDHILSNQIDSGDSKKDD
jgi:hypothetical protein